MLVFLYVSTILHVVLAAYVYYQNSRKLTHIYFSLFAIFIALWSYSNIAFLNAPSKSIMLFWTAIAYNAASLMLYFMHLFSVKISEKSITKIGFYTKTVVMLISLFIVYVPNFVYQDVDFSSKSIVTGNGVFLLFLIYMYFIFQSLYFIFRQKNKFTGTKKTQLSLIFLGLFLAVFFGVLFSIVFPALKNYSYVNLGPTFSLILLILITYNILKFQLFEIRLLFGKITYYLIISIPPYFTYFGLAFIYETAFGTSFNIVAYIAGIPIAFLFIGFLNFFTRFISEYTDTHLINPGYNPLLVLEQLRERLASSLDVERNIQEVLFIIARTIRPEYSGIIIVPENDTVGWLSVNYKSEPFKHPEEFKSFVYLVQKNKYNPVVRDDLNNPEILAAIDNISIERIKLQMDKHKVGAIVPLLQNYKITGLLLLGQKEANSPYTRLEINFVKSIANQASLAISRSLLYRETQTFNQTLQNRINLATQELVQKNQDLSIAIENIEEARRKERDMLDVMGHELRTPLSIARNALLRIKKQREGPNPDQELIAKYIDSAIDGTRREIGLLETMLSATKLDAAKMDLRNNPISLKELVSKSVEAHKHVAEKSKTNLIFNPPEQDIVISADRIRVREIMDNFLNNAIKYTGTGDVELRIYQEEGLGWVDVQDNGIGISPENIKNLGKKFFRAKTLYNNKSGEKINPSGTGLGLYVSFQLIDIMQGKKKIVSEVGKGSTFSFGLPIYTGTEPVVSTQREEDELGDEELELEPQVQQEG